MVFILPTDEELRSELDKRAADDADAQAALKDSHWCVKFTQAAEFDPADAHGA